MPTLSAPMASATAVTISIDESRPVLRGAAVGVVAQVDGRVEELVQQVTVRGVDLDAVETGLDGVAGCRDEVVHDAGELVGRQGTRLVVWLAGLLAVTISPGAATAAAGMVSTPSLLSLCAMRPACISWATI